MISGNFARGTWWRAVASAAGLGIAFSFSSAWADDPPTKKGDAAKTDDALRSQLDDDLFGDLKPSERPQPEKPAEKAPAEKPPADKPAADKPAAEKPPADKPAPPAKPMEEKGEPAVRIRGDADLRRSLEDRGEDIGAEQPMNPLIEIGERMKKVRERLAAGDVSPETQAEEEQIIAQIAKMMEQAQQQKKKQPSGGNSKTPSKPQPKPGDMGQKPGPMGEGDPNTESKKPAEESTNRLGTAKNEASGGVPREVLVKRAWGHLPPRLRERLINTPLDRFLPEYEQLIEDYFRRLAEERSDSP